MLATALQAGYPINLLGLLSGYRTIMDLILRRPTLRRLVSDVPGFNDQLIYALRGSDSRLQRRLALELYDRAGIAGKRRFLLDQRTFHRAGVDHRALGVYQ